ncbi:MAG: high-affinity branched-chain amino acid ABC transporter ATP-binding protein LivG [Desulfobacca sp. 4484_104]|nr:MAG: high-affinity branched-chain amino acid ABC transporter ATP-binding protein LivG [Desulfobacca sp. 4484_104]RLA87585.1 MAG: high-affinity branched-chain amino acid ABC transporter ATP-binding protein LivG [Deltaproteobacteria bacterium]
MADDLPLLQIRDLGMRFGGLTALDNIQLSLAEGSLCGLIGPNGAGKTTVFNLISGFLRPTAGQIFFQGAEITHLPPHRLSHLGIGRTFQNIRLFNKLSVLDNVRVACHWRAQASFWETIGRLPRFIREERHYLEHSLGLLAEVGLLELAQDKAGQLPYGHQRRLEIARALATRPQLLLLDEPAAGLNPQETVELMEFLQNLRARHQLTILLIEHNMKFVMGICERLNVLDHGLIIAEGTPSEVQLNPLVRQAYLGG